MASPEVRIRIPGYRDLVRVGAGGFSMVYRAHQEAFDRTVAVKVLTVELVDETAQRRFQRECRASGRLSNHPNIVTVLDSGFTEDGRPFITTEFMSNGSLADRLDRGATYTVAEVLDIGVKMCGALAAVHAAGILHRDIKPPNILVSDYGDPALADFGISAITVGPEASIGTSSLTPLHVAPEVLEGQPTNAASDVYSLGSTLYTLLAHRAPFQLTDDDALMPLMRRVVMDPVPDIARDDVPAEVVELLRYSMAKQPFSRYGTAVSFGEAIQATQAHLGYPVTPLRKPGTGAGDFVLPPAEALTETGEAAVAPASRIVDDPQLSEAAWPAPAPAHESAAAAGPAAAPIAPIASSASSAPIAPTAPIASGSAGASAAAVTTGPDPRAGSRSAPLLVGVAVLVVVALIAGALVLRSRGDSTVAAPAGARNGAPSGSAGAGSDGTTAGSVPGASNDLGLRFDIDATSLDTSQPTRGGVLRVALDAEPATWNPATARFYASTRLVADSIFDPLAVLTKSGTEPYLASAITPNDAFTEWTIELRRDVVFHDGSPLDAAAVKANFDARMANDLLARPIAPVQSVRAEGAKVIVSLRQPWPAFPVALSGQSGLIASPKFLTAAAGDKPIGTGAFSFVSWEQGKKVSLTKNTKYWMPDRPFLEGLDFSVIADPEARLSALNAGEVDVAFLTDPVAVDRVQFDHPALVAKHASVATVILNAKTGPTADLRVRRALAIGVDTSAVNDSAFGGKAYAAASPFPPGSPWTRNETQGQFLDADKARKLMEELGVSAEKPLKIELLVGQSKRQQAVGKLLQEQWKEIFVDTTLNTAEDTLGPIVDGKYQAAFWTYDVPTDPDEFYVWFHTDATPGAFTYNLARLSDPNLDRGLENGRKSSDPQQRLAAYGVVEQELINQAPAIWFAYLPAALATSPRVVGWTPDAMGGVGRGGRPWATAVGFK